MKQTLIQHYAIGDLRSKVDQALERAGFGSGPLDWADLARLDQFHLGGLAGTKLLAEKLALKSGSSFLDVGCGLGGPARFLAATYGCRVTGIDLSEPYIEVATMLGESTGLTESLKFQTGDATALDLPGEEFDHAWTIHVGMNVEDKSTFYKGIHRVLKAGGDFGIFDFVDGEKGPLEFPVPWASGPSISFLSTQSVLLETLTTVGFVDLTIEDLSTKAREWVVRVDDSEPKDGPEALNLGIAMGPDFKHKVKNLTRNLSEGKVRLVQIVGRK